MDEEEEQNLSFLGASPTNSIHSTPTTIRPLSSNSKAIKRPKFENTVNAPQGLKRPKIELVTIDEKPSIVDLQREVLEKEKDCLQSIERFCNVGIKFFEAGLAYVNSELKMKSEIFGDFKDKKIGS